MTTPASGPISLANVQAEFGGTNPISLSEYYSGGAYVTAGTTGGNGSNGISALTVIPTSAKISLANFYSASAGPAQMVIGARTVAYSSGKIFDYYDPAVISQTPSDVNITVSQDITATLDLTGGSGYSVYTGLGGMGHTIRFSFLFKAGITYVLSLGGPGVAGAGGSATGVLGGGGGGYSALFLGSKSFNNVIAIAGGGGGGAQSVTTSSEGSGGHAGSTTTSSPTGGTAWHGYSGSSSTPTGNGGVGGTGTTGGATGAGSNPGTAGSQLTGGAGGAQANNGAGGGGGGGYYGGGGGCAGASGSGSGGGGGGSSFIYTTSDSSGKTATYVSNITSSGSASWTQNASRALAGLAGQPGNNALDPSLSTTKVMTTWSGLGNWRRPYPGGANTPTVSYDLVLAADLTSTSTSLSVAFSMVTSASSLSTSSTLTLGADARRIVGAAVTVEFTISGTTYTKVVSSVSLSTIVLTTTLGVAVPAGQVILVYPVDSNVTTTPGALRVSTGLSNTVIFRIAEAGGTYVYSRIGSTSSGGTSTPLVFTLPVPIYSIGTLPKGSIIERAAASNTDTAGSWATSGITGGSCGAVRITFA